MVKVNWSYVFLSLALTAPLAHAQQIVVNESCSELLTHLYNREQITLFTAAGTQPATVSLRGCTSGARINLASSDNARCITVNVCTEQRPPAPPREDNRPRERDYHSYPSPHYPSYPSYNGPTWTHGCHTDENGNTGCSSFCNGCSASDYHYGGGSDNIGGSGRLWDNAGGGS